MSEDERVEDVITDLRHKGPGSYAALDGFADRLTAALARERANPTLEHATLICSNVLLRAEVAKVRDELRKWRDHVAWPTHEAKLSEWADRLDLALRGGKDE